MKRISERNPRGLPRGERANYNKFSLPFEDSPQLAAGSFKAMLLAAGLGTRLKPLTDNLPKPLIPVNGIPLILYNLALLKKYGLTKIVINLHYLGDQIKNLLGDGNDLGLDLCYSEEPSILGTGGGIMKAASFFQHEDFFLVLNADIITDLNLAALISFHQKHSPLATLVLKEKSEAENFGSLYVDQQQKIISILEKPLKNSPPTKEAFFTGIHVLSRRFFQGTFQAEKACIVRDAYIPLLKQGEKMMAYLNKGIFSDLGTPQRLAHAQENLSQGLISLSYQQELLKLQEKLFSVAI